MGLGAAQAIGFALGGCSAPQPRPPALWGAPAPAYASVFLLEALLFVAAAVLAARTGGMASRALPPTADAVAAAHLPSLSIGGSR